ISDTTFTTLSAEISTSSELVIYEFQRWPSGYRFPGHNLCAVSPFMLAYLGSCAASDGYL
ncbi:hypothetical protein CEXT_766921, partial [Caerostris extrusa]